MSKFILSLTALAIIGICLWINNYISLQIDINAAKNAVVTHLGKSRTVNEGLLALAGKSGSIKWSKTEVANTYNEHISMAQAIVSGKDQSEQTHTARFTFYEHIDSKNTEVDYSSLDNRELKRDEILKLIVSGKFE
jgi:hypothetical protein